MSKKIASTNEQRKLVENLYGYGLPVDEVRQHIINPETGKPIARQALFRVFRKELDAGQALANAKILETSFKIATDATHTHCAAMNMFWQKTRMGFKEVDRHEHTAADGASLTTLAVRPQLVIVTSKRVNEGIGKD